MVPCFQLSHQKKKMTSNIFGTLLNGLFSNPATGLGTSQDSREYTQVTPYIPTAQHILETLFLKSGFIEKVVSIPALDFVRNRFEILEDSDQSIKDTVVKEFDRLGFWEQLYKLKMYSRLYGRAHMILVTDTRYGDALFDQPLTPETIKNITKINVVSPDKLTPTNWNRDFTTDGYLSSKYYIGYGGKPIHSSYVFTIDNSLMRDSSLLATNLNQYPSGSVIERLLQPHKNNEMQHNAVASKMQSFTLLWRKVSDLVEKTTGKNKEKWLESFRTQQLLQSVLRVTLLDSTDEVGQLSANMSGIAAILEASNDTLFLHTDVPKILITGDVPGGLSTKLEGVLEPYYNKVSSEQVMQGVPILVQMARLIAGYKLNKYDTEFTIKPNPLWSMSEIEISAIRKEYADTFQTYATIGALTAQEIRQSVFGSMGWSTDVNLDQTTDPTTVI
jgi:uncharacterized protein